MKECDADLIDLHRDTEREGPLFFLLREEDRISADVLRHSEVCDHPSIPSGHTERAPEWSGRAAFCPKLQVPLGEPAQLADADRPVPGMRTTG